MIILSFTFLFLFSCKKENPCPQLSLASSNISNKEEYNVVESVLCDYTNNCIDFIQLSQESLSYDENFKSSLESYNQYLASISSPTIPIESYKTLNDSSFYWGDLYSVQPNLISKEELFCYFREDLEKGWNYYYDNFKDSRGYLMFGRPLIIEDKAFVEYAHYCGSLCGYGNFVILIKENEQWIVKETIFLWIS